MMYLIVMGCFWGIPIAAIIFWIVSLVLYLDSKKKDNVSQEQVKTRKTMFVIASIIAGILLAVVVGFIILMFMAVAFM